MCSPSSVPVVMNILLVLLISPVFQAIEEQIVLEETKDDILNTDDVDTAYEKYMSAFQDTSTGPIVETVTDMETYQKQREVSKKLFIKSLTVAREHNKMYERGESTYKMAVNRFFTMDKAEKKRYLGLNGGAFSTINQRYLSPILLPVTSKQEKLPNSFHWNYEGYLTDVKDQGDCGSCWAFSAISLVEWAYVKILGKNMSLSEQHLLDCVYEYDTERDGCEGGWYMEAWDYIIEGKNTRGATHLVKQSSYIYEERDNMCVNGVHANAVENIMKLTGYAHVPADEASVLNAVAFKMPLAVAITAEEKFYNLGKGLYDGCREKEDPNHAVILSGYGKRYFQIRNSWGKNWGVGGYGKLKRRGDICNILSFAYYIEYTDISNSKKKEDDKEEKKDEEKDKEKYTSEEEGYTTEPMEVDTSTCFNHEKECSIWAGAGYCETYKDYMKAYCKKSCSMCKCADEKTSRFCKGLKTRRKCHKKGFRDFKALNACPVSCEHCIPCPAGFYTHDLGCIKCPQNHYSSQGATECKKCPFGTASPSGSVKKRDCKNTCPRGFTECYGACRPKSQC